MLNPDDMLCLGWNLKIADAILYNVDKIITTDFFLPSIMLMTLI